MTVTLLGENDEAPGAMRRQSAHFKRDLADEREALAEIYRKEAQEQQHDARRMAEIRESLYGVPMEALTIQTYEYREKEETLREEAASNFAIVNELEEGASDLRRAARKDRVVAFVQTYVSKMGI